MSKSDRLQVVLLALTGFGNLVLEALLEDTRVNVSAVFTVKYDHPFPYYEERQLLEVCHQRGVDCYYDLNVNSNEGIEFLRRHSPDLIIMATFKLIIKANVLSLPPLGVVNFHPSLLPRYRGPCPTNAALFNDEQVTGVTVHYVTEGIDEGNILLQKSMTIDQADNDGQLRKKLAKLAGEMIPETIGLFTGFTKPAGRLQDHSLASFAPKPTAEDGYLELASDIYTIQRKVRAFNPIPGTSFRIGEKRIAVDRFEILQNGGEAGFYESENSIDVVIGSQAIRLYKKATE